MDALSLVLPAATIANPGANGADAGGGDARGEAVAADFAALLAAGLLPQQELPGLLPVPVAPAPAAAETAELELAEPSTAAEVTPLVGTTLLSHPGVMTRANATQDDAKPEAWAAASKNLRPAAEATLDVRAALAADAATIAAGAAAGAGSSGSADRVMLAVEAVPVKEAAAPAQSEPSALTMHPLYAGAIEKPAASQPTALLEVRAPVASPDFAQSLSQQVVWMADKDAQLAELRINPPELGPVEVRLQLSGDEATVQFTSAHAEVRGAIESAMARLRESMAQAGIQLGEASVSAESFRGQAERQADAREGRDGYRGSSEDAEPAWASRPIAGAVRRGLVDLFA